MRKLFVSTLVVALAALLLTSSALAATHNFTLSRDASVSGIMLEKGKYKLELDGTDATIYQRGKIVARAVVEIREGKVQNPGSVLLASDGSLKEIRLKDRVVVFSR